MKIHAPFIIKNCLFSQAFLYFKRDRLCEHLIEGCAVISTSDFRKGAKILFRDQPYTVVDYQSVKPGKGGAYIRTRMRNMLTGLVHEETFRSGEKFEEPDMQYRNMQYLYSDTEAYHFMDQDNYEQVSLSADQLGDAKNLLKEQEVYNILYFEERPIAVNPPLFMELEVKETPPGVRGDTAQGGATKPATLETGLRIQVPLFVNEGDFVKIDTRDLTYLERVKK